MHINYVVGFEVVDHILKGLTKFMDDKGYKSPKDFIGCAVEHITTPDKLVVHPAVATVIEERCNGCGICLKPGHCEAIEMKNKRAVVITELCVGCGVCRSLCPRGAITINRVLAS